jgi:uncharacterized membrane protein YhaH (DUF805 family)
MNFTDAIKVCFAKYADFNGRAKRPEYWWFALFCFAVALALDLVSSPASWAFSLATALPSLAAGTRRLHDINKSGWMQLLWLIPIFGWVYLIYMLAQPGDAADNQYGAVPAN